MEDDDDDDYIHDSGTKDDVDNDDADYFACFFMWALCCWPFVYKTEREYIRTT